MPTIVVSKNKGSVGNALKEANVIDQHSLLASGRYDQEVNEYL